MITLVIFISRNLLRLEKEFNQYSYNPLENNNYQFIGGDKKFHLRYNLYIEENIEDFDSINIIGKKIIKINKLQ